MAFFQRLTQRFQNVSFEFGQFVEEKNSVMRQRNLSGRGIDAATEQTSIAHGVVGRAKGAARNQGLPRLSNPTML